MSAIKAPLVSSARLRVSLTVTTATATDTNAFACGSADCISLVEREKHAKPRGKRTFLPLTPIASLANTKDVVGKPSICKAVGMHVVVLLRAALCLTLCAIPTACTKAPPDPLPGLAPLPELVAARSKADPAAPSASSSGELPSGTPPSEAQQPKPALGSVKLDIPSSKTTAKSAFGMVTSVEANASRAGVAMLEAGGNAVDAAVAVGFALAVTHPSAGNLGGGGFMLVNMVGQPTVALNFREQAPEAVNQPAFRHMIAQRARGTTASGIPGTVAGLNYALARWGSLPRAAVLQPAIAVADKGHALGERQALVLGWAWPQLSKNAEARRIFGKGARPLRTGERLRQPDLANTLRAIAAQGDSGFYSGAFGDALVRLTEKSDVPITATELSQYRARAGAPLRTRYRDLLVETAAPPSAGAVAVVQMLAMLEHEKAWSLPVESAAHLHLFAEVAKRAHAERRFSVVDPDSVADYDHRARLSRWRDPLTWLVPHPIDRQRSTNAAKLHRLYSMAVEELNNTTHFSVVDRDGNSVTCTTTLSAGFGAKYVVPGTGVVMNNSVGAFGTVGQDVLQPGRRMTSSMAPTLVSDNTGPVLLLGSPGGDTIPNTVVQVLRNLVDYNMPLDQAIEQPRIHHGFVPDAIRTERLRPIPAALRAKLRALGHAFAPASRTASALSLGGPHPCDADTCWATLIRPSTDVTNRYFSPDSRSSSARSMSRSWPARAWRPTPSRGWWRSCSASHLKGSATSRAWPSSSRWGGTIRSPRCGCGMGRCGATSPPSNA